MTTTINNEHKKLNVPNLRFPEFEGEWEKCKLGDICAFLSGGTPKIDIKEYWDGTIPFVSAISMHNTYISDSNLHISEKGLKNGSKLLKKNNLLLLVRGSMLWKSIPVCLIESDVAFNQDVKGIIPNDTTNNKFLLYWLKAKEQRLKYMVTGTGLGAGKLDTNDLLSMSVYAPSMNEQDKIAKLLSLLDERIATQNKIIEDLKKLKSAIIDYAINSLDSGFVKFGSLYEMAGEGGTPTTSNASFYDNGKIPFIKIDDLKKKYLTENKDFITELGLQKSSAWLVPSRSILFSNGATIGGITITTYPVCTKQGILGIVPKQNIDVEFLYYFMSSSFFKKAVSRIVTEGTMKTAYLKDINNILCPIPTKEKQQEIAKIPSALNSKIDFEQSILKLFCSQKQYLLRQMFI